MAQQNCGLNAKQKAFCDEYLRNGYKAQPAYEFAYGPQTHRALNANPYRLLKKPAVKEYIETRRKEIYDSMAIDAMRVGEKLADIAFSDKEDEIYTTQNKLKALELLTKILGMQSQKIETVDTIEVTLEDSNKDGDI